MYFFLFLISLEVDGQQHELMQVITFSSKLVLLCFDALIQYLFLSFMREAVKFLCDY